jgi:hypothetical protein
MWRDDTLTAGAGSAYGSEDWNGRLAMGRQLCQRLRSGKLRMAGRSRARAYCSEAIAIPLPAINANSNGCRVIARTCSIGNSIAGGIGGAGLYPP